MAKTSCRARRNKMSKMPGFISGFTLALGAISLAQAQVTIDVAKVSCDQYTSYYIKTPEEMAIWLHGFYSGKRNHTVIDTEGFRKEAKKLWDYCVRNPNIPVM